MLNELITLIARETGWTLEYIRGQPISYLMALAEEIEHQRAVERYYHALNSARIVCTLASTRNRHYQPSEIIGEPPKREGTMSKAKLARDPKPKKIKLADGKVYDLAPLTANMMADVEDRFDKSWEELTKKPMRKRPVILTAYLRLKPNYPELTEEQVGDLITEKLRFVDG